MVTWVTRSTISCRTSLRFRFPLIARLIWCRTATSCSLSLRADLSRAELSTESSGLLRSTVFDIGIPVQWRVTASGRIIAQRPAFITRRGSNCRLNRFLGKDREGALRNRQARSGYCLAEQASRGWLRLQRLHRQTGGLDCCRVHLCFIGSAPGGPGSGRAPRCASGRLAGRPGCCRWCREPSGTR